MRRTYQRLNAGEKEAVNFSMNPSKWNPFATLDEVSFMIDQARKPFFEDIQKVIFDQLKEDWKLEPGTLYLVESGGKKQIHLATDINDSIQLTIKQSKNG